MPGIVVLGARNLGGAILDHFLADGWQAAAVAQSNDTLAAIRDRGAIPLQADVLDPDELESALGEAAEKLGSLDAIVNAVSVARPGPQNPWGGGRLADAGLDQFQEWHVRVAQGGFVFLSVGARALRTAGGGTLVQISNRTAREPVPGSGLWSSGHHALRALTRAAQDELKAEGIHAAFLAVDEPIDSPKSLPRLEADGIPREAAADQAEIAKAVAYLVAQGGRGLSYDLSLTTAAAR